MVHPQKWIVFSEKMRLPHGISVFLLNSCAYLGPKSCKECAWVCKTKSLKIWSLSSMADLLVFTVENTNKYILQKKLKLNPYNSSPEKCKWTKSTSGISVPNVTKPRNPSGIKVHHNVHFHILTFLEALGCQWRYTHCQCPKKCLGFG